MKGSFFKTMVHCGPFLGLLAVFVFFAILGGRSFYAVENLRTILTQMVIVGIAAYGMLLVIVSGGIDLSVGSQLALSSVITALVLLGWGGESEVGGLGTAVAILAAVLACGLCGLFNGYVSSAFGIAPFIVTLGMMSVLRGMTLWLADQQNVYAPANGLSGAMMVEPAQPELIFSPGVWVMLACLILVGLLLKKTVLGRYITALGSSEATARLCGIPVVFYRSTIYALCGCFTGLAGVFLYANLDLASPTEGTGVELDIIAAVVIGGGSLSGGEGSALGTFVGALIMAVLRNGCNMLGVDSYVQLMIIGGIIILAAGIDRIKHKALA